jgi:hypothetical protein
LSGAPAGSRARSSTRVGGNSSRVPDQLEEIAHRSDYQPIRGRSTAVLGLR